MEEKNEAKIEIFSRDKKRCGDCDFWLGTCANKEISKNNRVGRIAASEICVRFDQGEEFTQFDRE